MLIGLTVLSILCFTAALAMSGLIPLARSVVATAGNSLRAMRDPATDDDARERAVRQASLRLFKAFLGLLLRTLVALAAGFVPILLADLAGLAEMERVLAFMARWDVIAVASILVTLGWWAALSLDGGPVAGYSRTDRFLHRVALGGAVLPDVLHDVERGAYLKRAPEARDGAHVFICGLARAGTTVLTRDLHATGAFDR